MSEVHSNPSNSGNSAAGCRACEDVRRSLLLLGLSRLRVRFLYARLALGFVMAGSSLSCCSAGGRGQF